MTLRSLIVDDNESFLEAARSRLDQDGLRVDGLAATSADALTKAAASHPDVVLVDIFLGSESGLELARRLVAEGHAVILISTYAEADVAELIAGIPSVGFLQKSELSAETIRRIVNGRPD